MGVTLECHLFGGFIFHTGAKEERRYSRYRGTAFPRSYHELVFVQVYSLAQSNYAGMSLSYLQQESTSAHPDSIWSLSWTPSNHLLTASASGNLRVYSPPDLQQPLYDLPVHSLGITSLSTSNDGRRAIAASLDGGVAMVDPSEGRIIGRVETGREKVGEEDTILPAYACALHPSLACWAWSGRSSKIAIRSISSDADAQSETNGAEDGGESSGSIGHGPLGGESTKVVDTGKGKFGMDLRFSPDGQSLALSTEAGTTVVLDTETQVVLATYNSHAMAVRTIGWSPDSQWLYSGSDDHRIVLHDVRAGSKTGGGGKGEGAVAILQGHQSWVLKVAASPDGKLLGSGGADNQIKLWDVGQRACVYTNQSIAEVWGFDWQPNAGDGASVGKQFAVGGDDRVATLYRAAGSV